MRRTLAIITTALIVSTTPAWACDDTKAKLNRVAVSRCLNREVTLSFNVSKNKRIFITINDADAKRIYESLKPYYD